MLGHSRGTAPGGRAARRLAALTAVGVALATLGGCTDDYYEETTGPERYGYGAWPGAAFWPPAHFGPPIFGYWCRVVTGSAPGTTGVVGNAGVGGQVAVVDETAWSFGTDGAGSRTITRHSTGSAPVVRDFSRFTYAPVGGGQIIIQFLPTSASGAALQLPYRLDGSFGSPVLTLDGIAFSPKCI